MLAGFPVLTGRKTALRGQDCELADGVMMQSRSAGLDTGKKAFER
jgi:hypothetical protein